MTIIQQKVLENKAKQEREKVLKQLNTDVTSLKKKTEEMQSFIHKQAHYYEDKTKSIIAKVETLEKLEKKINQSISLLDQIPQFSE